MDEDKNRVQQSTISPETQSESNIEEPQETPEKFHEDIYSAEDLIAGYKSFDTQPEVVSAALKIAGKQCTTEEEARKIIKKFLRQEVKR